jgi:solute carrier family 15 (oligopeptide transporter), member 1
VDTDSSKPPTTHPKGFFFLFAGEFAERFSFYGMRAILPLYLSDQMGFGEANGALYYTLFLGMCYFLPLVGGFIADNYIGKYWTIVGFSVPYIIGQFLVGFENKYMLIFALLLLAMGTGVTKPNISTLMGLTYDQKRPGQDKLRSNAFQYFYMSINIGAFLSQTIVPIVRNETGSYFIAFCVPAFFMIVALGLFAAGKPYYAVETISRHLPPPTEEEKATRKRVLGQLALLFLLVTFFWGVFDQSSYTWVYFARTYMDRVVGGYELAPDQIQALNPFFIVAFIGGALVYRTFFTDPNAPQSGGMPPTNKMLIGFVLTAVCMGIMAVAGYLAGPKQDAIRVSTKEGEFIVQPSDTKLADVAPADGVATVAFKGGVTLTATGWGYDKEKKKATFTGGELTFADGKKAVITDGRVAFDKSDALPAGTANPAGTLETKLKAGEYAAGGGTAVVGPGNTIVLRPSPAAPAADDKPAKASVDEMDWVKPGERVTVWWMALAFFILTLAEVLISVTGLELAFVVAPQSMKGFITACWLLTVALANWFINAPIAGLYPAMTPGNYFLMLTAFGLLVTVLFIPVSNKFKAIMAAGGPDAARTGGDGSAQDRADYDDRRPNG